MYKNDNSSFLTFGVTYLCFVIEIDFMSALLLEYSSKYFDGIWLKCRTGRDGVLSTRVTTLPFLLLAYLPLLYLTDNALILCLLCKLNTIGSIFMILGRNVEQD